MFDVCALSASYTIAQVILLYIPQEVAPEARASEKGITILKGMYHVRGKLNLHSVGAITWLVP